MTHEGPTSKDWNKWRVDEWKSHRSHKWGVVLVVVVGYWRTNTAVVICQRLFVGHPWCLTQQSCQGDGIVSQIWSQFKRWRTWPEWISTHQCTSWSFCPLNGLRFFIGRRMGFMTVHFFLLLTIVLFFFLVPARFSLDLTSHIATLFTFLPSYCTHHLPY
jgi:hypothetical protein